jgi:beta-glucosidase
VSSLVALTKGKKYRLEAKWFSVIRQSPPELGVALVSPQIRSAVRAAQDAQVAIVFASEFSTEGADHDTMNLPGDENALIEAVARTNPRTIVVLNTGNAVYMPWISQVQGVLEDWYPGEEDGRAIAAILTGAFDPSGRLPITFPRETTVQPVAVPAQFPGIDGTVNFGSSAAALDIGYRWYQANHLRPLFAFGYGLSYTSFTWGDATIRKSSGNITVSLKVKNTGPMRGVDVVQLYIEDPQVTGEAPEQLKAFARVVLPPDGSRNVTLKFPLDALQIYSHGVFITVPGRYRVRIGDSSGSQSIHFGVNIA